MAILTYNVQSYAKLDKIELDMDTPIDVLINSNYFIMMAETEIKKNTSSTLYVETNNGVKK